MKLSFCTLATPSTDISEIVRLAVKFGYHGVDLRISEAFGELSPKSTTAQVKHVRNLFKESNLQIAGLFCYNKGGTEDQKSWGEMESSIFELLDLANMIGSPSIRIGTGNPRNAISFEDYYKRTAEVIGNVLNKDRSTIELHIQNHSGSYDVSQSYKLVKMVNNPRFRMAFAPEHCIVENENLDDVLIKAKEITAQLHVADIIKQGTKVEEVLPGHGITPLKEAWQALGRQAFDGWVTFKWERQWHPELMPAEEALPKFIEYIKMYFV